MWHRPRISSPVRKWTMAFGHPQSNKERLRERIWPVWRKNTLGIWRWMWPGFSRYRLLPLDPGDKLALASLKKNGKICRITVIKAVDFAFYLSSLTPLTRRVYGALSRQNPHVSVAWVEEQWNRRKLVPKGLSLPIKRMNVKEISDLKKAIKVALVKYPAAELRGI